MVSSRKRSGSAATDWNPAARLTGAKRGHATGTLVPPRSEASTGSPLAKLSRQFNECGPESLFAVHRAGLGRCEGRVHVDFELRHDHAFGPVDGGAACPMRRELVRERTVRALCLQVEDHRHRGVSEDPGLQQIRTPERPRVVAVEVHRTSRTTG